MYLSRLSAIALVIMLVGLGTPLLVPQLGTPAHADAGSVTGDWHRWDPLANRGKGAYDASSTPTVTVEQTANLVDQVVRVSWTGFTPSSNDPAYAAAPTSGVSAAQNVVLYPVEVLECRAAVPHVSPFSVQDSPDCYTAEVISPADGGHGQNNAIVAVTQPDGSGHADLHVENSLTNDLLGCDQTHDCTIVVVPDNGGDQPFPADDGTASCDSHQQDHIGPPDYDQAGTAAANYLGATCSWADRIEVPIHFAALPTDCPNVAPAFVATGSPMLRRGLGQLQAGWCRGTNAVSFGYNSTSSEYEARAQFGSGADVALVTRPADVAPKTFTYAPVANTAISIAYYVDNVHTGLPMTDLQLTPRLVVKLLTQFYQPFGYNCQSATDASKPGNGCAPEVSGNPTTILDDPEFQQLNFRSDHPDRSAFPSRNSPSSQDTLGGFLATVIAGDSDLTYELTRWIAADKDVLAFLQGKPDNWGKKINPNYRTASGVLYPTSQFQALDPGWTPAGDDTEHHFQEGFQGTWNPITGLDNIATTLVGNRSSAVDTTSGSCPTGNSADCLTKPGLPINFARLAAEPEGSRDLWAVVDNSSAQAYRFPTAQLVNAKGVAVAPTTQGMTAGLAATTVDADGITRLVDHAHETAGSYPLTEPVYAMVPTCGVSAAKAAAIRSFLAHIASSQSYGVAPGTLPAGMLALDAAQLVQTKAAAAKVSSTSCTKSAAPPSGNASGHGSNHHSTTSSDGSSDGSSNGSDGGSTAGGGDSGGATTGTGGSAAAATSSTASTPTKVTTSAGPTGAAPTVAAKDVGYKAPDQSGTMSVALPVLLLVGAAFLVGAPLIWLLSATSAGAALTTRLAFWR